MNTIECLNCCVIIPKKISAYKNGIAVWNKFCTRSCAAQFNNRLSPKRLPESKCKNCEKPVITKLTYCSESCRSIFSTFQMTSNKTRYGIKKPKYEHKLTSGGITYNWSEITLDDVKGTGDANFGGRYPYIRTLGRKWYIKSDRPLTCSICCYSNHVDICHIQDVSSFSGSTSIAEINRQSNLIALCKNHHWEFDHNLL